MIRHPKIKAVAQADPLPAVPQELKEIPNWIAWKLVTRNGEITKPPFVVGTDFTKFAKSTDPATWTSYAEAVSKTAINDAQGVGFVIHGTAAEKEIAGIDMDGCRDPKTGQLTQWAHQLMDLLDSYGEVTPSGTGIRVWVKGKWTFDKNVFELDPKAGIGDKVKIEIYSRGRYFTVTGNSLTEEDALKERDLADVYNLCREIQARYKPEPTSTPVSESNSASAEGAKIQQKGSVVTNKLELLMNGTIQSTKPFVIADGMGNSLEYPSHSEADMALCTALALKHGDNVDLIWDDYLKSPLCRDRWVNREEYFKEHTIFNAIVMAKKIKDGPSDPASAAANPSVNPDAEEDEIQEQEEALPLFPRFPGLLTELCDAICPDIPYEFKFMAAITHWGLIRSGLDSLEGEPTLQPRFFTCFVKEPDYGKTAAINELRNAMKMIGQRYSDVTSVDSGPALVDEFSDVQGRMLLASAGQSTEVNPPARVLLDPDEMSDLFEKSKTTAQGRNSLSKELLKLYESTRTGNRSRKAGRSQIENAHLAILGGATPDGYRIMWTGTGGGSGGLQSRFILITTQNGKMPVKKQPTNAAALARVLEQLIPLSVSDPRAVRLSHDSQTMLIDWWKSTARDKPSEDRISDMVKRLLIVLAPTNGVAIVEPALMAQAIEWGNYLIACREKFNPADSYSWTQAFENDIRAVGQRHKEALTFNDYRRLVKPYRKPGGLGPFIVAWKNMVTAGELRQGGVTRKGTQQYRL